MRRSIESEMNQDYLLQDVLLKKYSVLLDGEQTTPANVIERAVDLHALRITGSSGYQKCVNYLWRGWLVQDENDPSAFVDFKNKGVTTYWSHVDPDRMRAPIYQNATQIIFSMIYLALYTGAINTVNPTGDLDVIEILLYVFTLGFVCDEVSKLWKVGKMYIGFWNVFNVILYALLTTSLVTRVIALGHPIGDEKRQHFNELSYNFLGRFPYQCWRRHTDLTSFLCSNVLDETALVSRFYSLFRGHARRLESYDERVPNLLRPPHRHHRRLPPSVHRHGQR